MTSVESLAVEGGVVYDDQFANKVEDSFGFVDDKNGIVFMEGLNPKNKIQFELETGLNTSVHIFPISQSSPEQSFYALIFESGKNEMLIVEFTEEIIGEHAILYFAKG